ncbi:HNH endonuclease [Capnocytophaga leadbetteri]|uniref:HNH endonuclease n=1 Tax=Capnocytophaga leadbetteri TaxID=327575 RepID=UPI0028E5BF10|nr:HNH endonuclease [Capnocytophaga leadbetteri]
MIQLQKTTTAPASLATKNKYDGEDVKALLARDHYDKCYICERQLTTDFQVEHLHSQEHYPDEKYNWENLFFACSYCNGRKSDKFDDIVNPTKEAIEEKIVQKLNYRDNKADFITNDTSETIQQTIKLLNRIFNGKQSNLRDFNEKAFFRDFSARMSVFEQAVYDYLSAPTQETKEIVRELLSIEQEFLGFKYWIIKNNPTLFREFSNNIIWNK